VNAYTDDTSCSERRRNLERARGLAETALEHEKLQAHHSKGSAALRDAWEQEANIALERAGREERVDKRSLQDQGIDREPQLHVGAGAEKLRPDRTAEPRASDRQAAMWRAAAMLKTPRQNP
jgi:hypothetical protein